MSSGSWGGGSSGNSSGSGGAAPPLATASALQRELNKRIVDAPGPGARRTALHVRWGVLRGREGEGGCLCHLWHG